MTWQPEIDELRRREALALKMGGEANVTRQHDNGKLTVLCGWVPQAYEIESTRLGPKKRGFRP